MRTFLSDTNPKIWVFENLEEIKEWVKYCEIERINEHLATLQNYVNFHETREKDGYFFITLEKLKKVYYFQNIVNFYLEQKKQESKPKND